MRLYHSIEDFRTLDRKLAIIERYRRKVQKYTKRKRGNPQNVREAMAWIQGLDVAQIPCECCGSTKRVQLHHRNGVWQDYYVHNLVFICAVCHQAEHNGCWQNVKHLQQEEDIMAVIHRTDWNGYHGSDTMTRREKLKMLVQSAKDQGTSVTAICASLSTRSQELFGQAISPQTLESSFYFKQASAVVDSEPAKQARPVKVAGTQPQHMVMNSSHAVTLEVIREALANGFHITLISK